MTALQPLGIIQPGIYYDLPAADYFAAPGLSNSMLKDLDVDPLNFWYWHINPHRPERPATPAKRLGKALHAAVLEQDTFNDRYDCEVTKADFDGCLETVKDIKAFLDARQVPYKASAAKPELEALALRADPTVKLLDREMSAHTAGLLSRGVLLENILPRIEWERTNGMAKALLREVALKPILANGKKEVSFFVIDPATGVLLKSRMDWITPTVTLDPKTVSVMGYDVDRAVNKAIMTYRYLQQAVFYTNVRKLAGHGDTDFVNAYVTSEMPHSVRLRYMGPNGSDTPPRYWEAAQRHVRGLIDLYARCVRKYGERPWVEYNQEIVPVTDKDIKVWEDVDGGE